MTKDFSFYQKEDNAIFSIIFNSEKSYDNLKVLAIELKNWDRGLHIYQQIVCDETPVGFEIIEVDQGSIEVVISLLFSLCEKLLDVFKTGFECYAAYLAYKTLVHDNLIKSYKGNSRLIKSEEEREKLLLQNVRDAVREEIKSQAKKGKKHEALEKKIDEVTKLVTEHIIKGNSVKLLSAPADKQEITAKEQEKEDYYIKSQSDYKKLDAETKLLLLTQFTSELPPENYEHE